MLFIVSTRCLPQLLFAVLELCLTRRTTATTPKTMAWTRGVVRPPRKLRDKDQRNQVKLPPAQARGVVCPLRQGVVRLLRNHSHREKIKEEMSILQKWIQNQTWTKLFPHLRET